MRKPPIDVVTEFTRRAGGLRPGPRAAVEKMIPAAVSLFADLEAAEHDKLLSELGRVEKKKGSLQPVLSLLAEMRTEKVGGVGSGGYRYRIKLVREQSAKEALKREPDPRTQAILDRRGDRLLRSLEPFDALTLKALFWQLPPEDRQTLEEAGVRVFRGANGVVSVEPWIPAELAEESRTQRMTSLDPEAAALITELEADLRDIEHFEHLLENVATEAAGVEVGQIRVVA